MATILTLDEMQALIDSEPQTEKSAHKSTATRMANVALITEGDAVSFLVTCDEEASFTRSKEAPTVQALAAAYNRVVKAMKAEKVVEVKPLKVKGAILVRKIEN